MNQENEVQREVLKMPIPLRIVRILMITHAVLIGINGLLSLSVPIILVAALLSWLMFAMASAIKACKKWPRYIMVAISAISLFVCIFPIIGGGMHAGYVQLAIVSIVFAVVYWIPTAILFLPSSNDWFATKKQAAVLETVA